MEEFLRRMAESAFALASTGALLEFAHSARPRSLTKPQRRYMRWVLDLGGQLGVEACSIAEWIAAVRGQKAGQYEGEPERLVSRRLGLSILTDAVVSKLAAKGVALGDGIRGLRPVDLAQDSLEAGISVILDGVHFDEQQ